VKFTLQPAIFCSFFNLSARWGWVANVTPCLVYPQEWPGSHCTEGWLVSRVVWTVVENIPHIGIQSPHSPYRNDLPYWLSESGPHRLQAFILRSALFWNLTQCRMILPYRHFRITYRSSLQEFFLATWPLSKISEERRSHLHHGRNLNSRCIY